MPRPVPVPTTTTDAGLEATSDSGTPDPWTAGFAISSAARASTSGENGVVESTSGQVRATPPSRPGGYWRISVYDHDGTRIRQTTGGHTRTDAEQRVADEERRLQNAGLPGDRAVWGRELFDYFLDDARPKFPRSRSRRQAWSGSYAKEARATIDAYLRPVLGPLRLSSWSSAHAYRALDRCPTNYVVAKTRRVLSSVVSVGLANGHLRAEQASLHRVTVPLRVDARPARGAGASPRGDEPLLVPAAEVPGKEQVRLLAESFLHVPPICATRWELWVYLLAYGGLRVGELFALTGPDVLTADQMVSIAWQVDEAASGACLAPPKNNRSRLAVICSATPQGFPLWTSLTDRAAEACEEQRLGTNPKALIAPAPRGGWWSRSNFRSRCFVPAALAAGWPVLTWQGPLRIRSHGTWRTVRTTRRDFVHTTHALRHHYACTARDLWHWSGAELCANGGWADPAFVIARYYGTTPEVHTTALAKQQQACVS